jgi:hypothetical protein
MKPRRLLLTAFGVATLSLALSIVAPGFRAIAAADKPLPAQTSREGAVTVKVTPLVLSAQSAVWRFEVVFDTHVAELNHDVVAVTSLTAGGKELRPMSWEGDKPGGHHRKGVLAFEAFKPAPASVTLKIRDVGGAPERGFNWAVPAP